MRLRDENQDIPHVSLMAYDQYMRFVNGTSILTEEEERALFERIERGKVERAKPYPDTYVLEDAQQARDRVVEGYQRLVIFMAKRYQQHFRSMDMLDLIQEANLGLLEAIESNDSRKGLRLQKLASCCIRTAFYQALHKRDTMICLPEATLAALRQKRRVEQQRREEGECEPVLAEVAAMMGVTEARVCEIMVFAEQQQIASVQALVREQKDDDCHGFMSASEMSRSREELSDKEVQRLHQAVARLPLCQREVIELRYGLAPNNGHVHSQLETAQHLGKLKQSVFKAEHRAYTRLRVLLTPLDGRQEEEGVA